MYLFHTPPENFSPRVETAGVYCLLHNRILFLKRSAHKPLAGLWGIPGGKLEKGETPLAAALREVQEETSLVLEPSKLSYINKVYIRIPEWDFIFHLFRYTVEGEPQVFLNEEHELFHWVTKEEALQLSLILGGKECLEYALEN